MPAPRPVSVSYMDGGTIGLLAQRSGEGILRDRRSAEAAQIIDSTRRYQLGQQEIQSRERMFALEQAYQNRTPTNQPQQQPAATRQQQLQDTLRQMTAMGTVTPEQAQWLQLSSLGVGTGPVNQAFGIESGGGLTAYQQQSMQQRQQAEASDSQIKAAKARIELAESQMEQYQKSLPEGIAVTPQEEQQLKTLQDIVNKEYGQLVNIHEGLSQPTAAPGGGMGGGGGGVTYEQAQGMPNGVMQDESGQIYYWNGREYVPR